MGAEADFSLYGEKNLTSKNLLMLLIGGLIGGVLGWMIVVRAALVGIIEIAAVHQLGAILSGLLLGAFAGLVLSRLPAFERSPLLGTVVIEISWGVIFFSVGFFFGSIISNFADGWALPWYERLGITLIVTLPFLTIGLLFGFLHSIVLGLMVNYRNRQ